VPIADQVAELRVCGIVPALISGLPSWFQCRHIYAALSGCLPGFQQTVPRSLRDMKVLRMSAAVLKA
jgi:hypothetical protein